MSYQFDGTCDQSKSSDEQSSEGPAEEAFQPAAVADDDLTGEGRVQEGHPFDAVSAPGNELLKLYVKNFPDSWTEETVSEAFAEFGTITSTAVREDKKGRKFAFVNYETHEDAQKAVEVMHMKEMRTPEEIEKAKEDGNEEELGTDGHPAGKLYAQRAQLKNERPAELRDKFSASTVSKCTFINFDENTDNGRA